MFNLYKNLCLKPHVILFLLRNNYQHRRYFLCTHKKKSKTEQADWIPAFAGLKALRELSVKTGTTTDANINLKKLSNDQLLFTNQKSGAKRKTN